MPPLVTRHCKKSSLFFSARLQLHGPKHVGLRFFTEYSSLGGTLPRANDQQAEGREVEVREEWLGGGASDLGPPWHQHLLDVLAACSNESAI